jgi:hypothetical protein
MTIERPMFPPRAESVDSFSSESGNLNSPKPVEGNTVAFPKPFKRPKKRKSALVGLKRSGLELVPSRSEAKGEPATEEQMAKIDFSPWKKNDSDLTTFGGEHWHSQGIHARFAYALMLMSKKEMIEFHRDIDQDQIDLLFANLFEGAEFLKYTAGMMESAYARLLSSACAALAEGVLGDGKQPLRFEGCQTRPTLVRQRR